MKCGTDVLAADDAAEATEAWRPMLRVPSPIVSVHAAPPRRIGVRTAQTAHFALAGDAGETDPTVTVAALEDLADLAMSPYIPEDALLATQTAALITVDLATGCAFPPHIPPRPTPPSPDLTQLTPRFDRRWLVSRVWTRVGATEAACAAAFPECDLRRTAVCAVYAHHPMIVHAAAVSALWTLDLRVRPSGRHLTCPPRRPPQRPTSPSSHALLPRPDRSPASRAGTDCGRIPYRARPRRRGGDRAAPDPAVPRRRGVRTGRRAVGRPQRSAAAAGVADAADARPVLSAHGERAQRPWPPVRAHGRCAWYEPAGPKQLHRPGLTSQRLCAPDAADVLVTWGHARPAATAVVLADDGSDAFAPQQVAGPHRLTLRPEHAPVAWAGAAWCADADAGDARAGALALTTHDGR